MVTDPVCKMNLEQTKAAAKENYDGKEYYFCSDNCHKKFVAEPKKYAAGMPQGGGHHHGH